MKTTGNTEGEFVFGNVPAAPYRLSVRVAGAAPFTALAQHFRLPQDEVSGCRTYGGHGEMMAVFTSTAKVSGRPLTELIGTAELTDEAWESIKAHVRQGGKKIIQLRGRH